MQKTILCVDDDADDRWLLTEAISLVQPEVSIVEAENGQKALDYLQIQKSSLAPLPSLIILDINMPFLDGKETLSRIKADPELQGVPVVIFTSSENPNDKKLFNSQGVPFLSKPYSIDHMTGVVGNLLDHCA